MTNSGLVIFHRLQNTYEVVPGSGSSTAKEEVYRHYCRMCDEEGKATIARATFGKVVHKAFPGIKCNRLGKRGEPVPSVNVNTIESEYVLRIHKAFLPMASTTS